MALTNGTTFSPIASALGNADAKLQDTLNISDTAQTLYLVRSARKSVGTEVQLATDSDYDDLISLESSLRALEKTVPNAVNPVLYASIAALETYFKAETGSTFRTYWNSKTTDSTITFTDNFRTLWRRAKNEELIVKLGDVTRSGGVWPGTLSNTKTITNPSLLEVRTGSLIGAASIIVNVTAVKADNTTDLLTLTIPAAAPSGTSYSIGGNVKYASVSAISITGGTNGDVVAVWIR